jgi:hypothetical protein
MRTFDRSNRFVSHESQQDGTIVTPGKFGKTADEFGE